MNSTRKTAIIVGVLFISATVAQLCLLNIYGIESTDILALPIGVNEMFLAGWLIVKGFNSPAIDSESTGTDLT